MADPSKFDAMLDLAFLAATVVYATIGVAGYLMFGNAVSDEVYNRVFHTVIVVLTVRCSSVKT